jgi:hypothetical protein
LRGRPPGDAPSYPAAKASSTGRLPATSSLVRAQEVRGGSARAGPGPRCRSRRLLRTGTARRPPPEDRNWAGAAAHPNGIGDHRVDARRRRATTASKDGRDRRAPTVRPAVGRPDPTVPRAGMVEAGRSDGLVVVQWPAAFGLAISRGTPTRRGRSEPSSGTGGRPVGGPGRRCGPGPAGKPLRPIPGRTSHHRDGPANAPAFSCDVGH